MLFKDGMWWLQRRLFPKVFPTDGFIGGFTTPLPSFAPSELPGWKNSIKNPWKFDGEIIRTRPEKQSGFHCRRNKILEFEIFISDVYVKISAFPQFSFIFFLIFLFGKERKTPPLNSYFGVIPYSFKKTSSNIPGKKVALTPEINK